VPFDNYVLVYMINPRTKRTRVLDRQGKEREIECQRARESRRRWWWWWRRRTRRRRRRKVYSKEEEER